MVGLMPNCYLKRQNHAVLTPDEINSSFGSIVLVSMRPLIFTVIAWKHPCACWHWPAMCVHLQEKVEPHSPPPAPPIPLLPTATSTPMVGSAAPCTMDRMQHDSVSRLSDDSGDESTVVQPTGELTAYFFIFFYSSFLSFLLISYFFLFSVGLFDLSVLLFFCFFVLIF